MPRMKGGLENTVSWTVEVGRVVRDHFTQTPHFSLSKLKPGGVAGPSSKQFSGFVTQAGFTYTPVFPFITLQGCRIRVLWCGLLV